MDGRAQQQYLNGYEKGRTVCLTKRLTVARHHLARRSERDAYTDGYRSAVYDYEDANGLPHETSATAGW